MPRELREPPGLHESPGYGHVAVTSSTTLVYVAGQVALDPEFELIGAGDLAEQTRAAMRNVEIALAEGGAGWDDVVRRTIYTTRPTEWETIGAAIDEVTGERGQPPQTVLGVTSLALPELLIEIEVTAAIDA